MCDTSGRPRQEGMCYIYHRFSWSAQDATRCEPITTCHTWPTRSEDYTLPSATSTLDMVSADFQEYVFDDIKGPDTATYSILPGIFQRHHSTTGQQDIYVRYERLTQTGRYVLHLLPVFLIGARCYQIWTNCCTSHATNKIGGPHLAFCNKYVRFVWHGGCWLPGVCVRRHQIQCLILWKRSRGTYAAVSVSSSSLWAIRTRPLLMRVWTLQNTCTALPKCRPWWTRGFWVVLVQNQCPSGVIKDHQRTV